jgi:hypothetical protein
VRRRLATSSPLPDAVGDLGARRLERWVNLTLVAVVLLGLAAAGLLVHLGAVGGTDSPPPREQGAEAPVSAVRAPAGTETILSGARP